MELRGNIRDERATSSLMECEMDSTLDLTELLSELQDSWLLALDLEAEAATMVASGLRRVNSTSSSVSVTLICSG